MKTLVDLLNISVQKYSSLPALSMRPRWRLIRWTFRDLYNFSSRVASLLEKHNVGYQDKVILISPNSPMWSGALFGCFLKGVVVVPLNPQSSKEFIQKIIDETGAKLILKSFLIRLPDNDTPAFDIDQLEEIDTKFTQVAVKPDDMAEIVYTSGTTGDPKGVVLTHNNILSNVLSLTSLFSVTKKEMVASVLPLFHMYEQVACLFIAIYFGIEIMYSPSVSSRAISSTLKESKATKLLVVPEILETILRKIENKAKEANKEKKLNTIFSLSQKLPFFLRRILFRRVHKNFGGRLKMIACGGAVLHEDIERKWNLMGFEVYQGYGLTETSPALTSNYPGCVKIGSVGKPVPKVEVKLKEGEIVAKGPNVFSGYYKDQEKTKEVFDDEGYFKTGDMGRFDDDGFLYISGRSKYMIVTPSGENVYPEDLESKLNANPGVQDSAVIGVGDGHRILIHAVLLGDIKNPTGIIEKVNEELSPHQRIQDWSIWPDADFPRSATRKVKKEEVIKWVQSKDDDKPQAVTTASPLINLLSAVSGKDVNKIQESSLLYQDLHFDSLMRIELVGRLEESMDVIVEEQNITNKTTVKDLAELIEKSKKDSMVSTFKSWLLFSPIVMLRDLILNIIVFPVYRFRMKVKVDGLDNIKDLSEPVIFMINHTSFIDGIIVLRALPGKIRRRIAISAALDFLYTYYWWAAWFVEFLFNTYPFPRKEEHSIRPGLEYTGKLLDRGYSIMLFPEGKVSLDGSLDKFKNGAGVLATEMDVPVVIINIDGIQKLMDPYQLYPRKRGVVSVKISKPIKFGIKDSYMDVTKTLHDQMKGLK